MAEAVRTVDHHTGGEPFPIVPQPPVPIPSGTLAQRRVGVIADPADPADPADLSGTTDVRIDVPSGRVTARVQTAGAKVTDVDVVSVPTWSVACDVPVGTSRGTLAVDIGFGGAFHTHLDVASLGLAVTREQALVHESVVGSRFRAVVEGEVMVDRIDAVVPVVTGSAFPTGEQVFVADSRDELARVFLLR